MDTLLDNISRILGTPMPRRKAIGYVGRVLGAALLAGFAAQVWAQVFLAQMAGTWKRLKLCHNPPCASAFYDRSKNNSGVWHDVKMCGNAVNLRASRARRVAGLPTQHWQAPVTSG